MKDAGDPVELAAKYDQEGADELVFLDITASSDKRNTVFELVRRCAEKVFIPFTIGGGIRTVEDARKLLREGAEKVSINTAAVKDINFVKEASKKFGTQCMVVAVDAKKTSEGKWEIFTHGGRENTGIDAIKFSKNGWKVAISARRAEILNDISRQNENIFPFQSLTNHPNLSMRQS